MTQELEALLRSGVRPRALRDLVSARPLSILVAAPHPDDFDAIALSLRHLHGQGHQLQVAVLTSGASGVDDGFGGADGEAAKAALREAEQRESCAFFGLAPQRLHFLSLWAAGADEAADAARLQAWMARHRADIVFMPHGNDSNATHRRTYATVCAAAAGLGWNDSWACLNQDAKTLEMRVDLFLDYDQPEAEWKAALLRHHRSQQARNLRTRGSGFDQRVLQVNRQAAEALGTPRPYAEVFQLMRLGAGQ
ncbi:PIG-L deacetylase family protein [Caenimonas terrae]|uniref:PIG-L deacetylase family protein n=1 Tax=Caenimonas terrae TaxID=696074 RepID=A0ABW0NG02_9BURK